MSRHWSGVEIWNGTPENPILRSKGVPIRDGGLCSKSCQPRSAASSWDSVNGLKVIQAK